MILRKVFGVRNNLVEIEGLYKRIDDVGRSPGGRMDRLEGRMDGWMDGWVRRKDREQFQVDDRYVLDDLWHDNNHVGDDNNSDKGLNKIKGGEDKKK